MLIHVGNSGKLYRTNIDSKLYISGLQKCVGKKEKEAIIKFY